MSLRVLNPNAEVLNKSAALHININAAKGLLVGGAGDIKLTKDGNTLLKEMVISSLFFVVADDSVICFVVLDQIYSHCRLGGGRVLVRYLG
ncbi:T-complex protein 1 subunit zeta [Dionaea muscipula]